ncbi:MAG TPA: tRNA-binding protein [Actinomycetota bacterium]|nr:tRNA-binding protein [Actinomycetota bacterium]
MRPQITFGKFENVDMRVARVIGAPMAEGTRAPSRVFELDLGPLGTRTSVGQYALIGEEELVGRNVVACVNLGSRPMGRYVSEVLVLGAPHPESPGDQSQATPLFVSSDVEPGSRIF